MKPSHRLYLLVPYSSSIVGSRPRFKIGSDVDEIAICLRGLKLMLVNREDEQ